MTQVTIELKNGEKFSAEKESYKGFFLNPFTWEDVIKKFKKLAGNRIAETTKDEIVRIIQNFEGYSVSELLERVVVE
jgi:2-methylcitrate dehydratase PrpD